MEKKTSKNVVVRTLIQNNGSLYVNVPEPFATAQGLRAGDKVVVIWGANMKVTTMEKPALSIREIAERDGWYPK